MLQIDPCAKIVRRKNLLEEINNSKNRDFVATLENMMVITNYGKRKIYKIIEIMRNMTPMSTFYYNDKKQHITFAMYFQERYGLNVN